MMAQHNYQVLYNNTQQIAGHAKKKIADVDACSLYPSAVNTMLIYLQGASEELQQNLLNDDVLKNKMDTLSDFNIENA